MIKKKQSLSALLFTALLCTQLFTSCHRKPVDQAPVIHSVQITQFKMSSNELPELGTTFFSIDQRKGTIYNATPLPYKSHFNKVLLDLKTDKENTLQVVVEGQVRDFGEKDSIDFTGWEKGVELRLTNKETGMHKSYQLKVNIYQYDPRTYEWSNMGTGSLPRLSDGHKVAFFGVVDNTAYMLTSGNNASQLYACPMQEMSTWNKVQDFSFAADNAAITKEGDNLVIFANTTNNKLYVGNINSVREVKQLDGSFVKNIMGAYVKPETGKAVAAVVLQYTDENHSQKFASIGTDYLQQGTHPQAVMGVSVPADMPSYNGSSIVFTQAHYPNIVWAGSASTGKDAATQIWSTTSQTDWLTLAADSAAAVVPHTKAAPTLLYDVTLRTYYLFVYKGESPFLYTSVDGGKNWEACEPSLMLPHDAQFQACRGGLYGYTMPDKSLVLIGGYDAAGKWIGNIWHGIAKKYAQQ